MTLHSHCSLKVVVLLCPQRWLDALRRAQKLCFPVSGWKLQSLTTRNAAHGGSIEADHQALCLLPTSAADALSAPEVSSEAPEPMPQSLDMDLIGGDFLWMSNLRAMPPDAIQQAREATHSCTVERLVKHRCAMKPTFGCPTYSTRGPAPPIATPEPHEELFGAPFAIWAGGKEPTSKRCQPIR